MKSFTDIEQSKKLAKILPLKSADMSWVSNGLGKPFARTIPLKGHPEEICGCWSLAALLEQLPVIEGCRPYTTFDTLSGEYEVSYVLVLSADVLYVHASNLLDACYEMILKLKEKDLL